MFDFAITFDTPAQPETGALVEAEQAQPTTAPAASMRDLSCLVVDDNPTARTVLGEMAASFGWRVDVAASGEEALAAVAERLAQQRAYDVVFIDWRMPVLDGWETSCRIRALNTGSTDGKLPLIVMVTAHDREMLAQRQQGLAPVLDGFVVKPVTASMLFDAVAEARMEHRPAPVAVRAPAGARLAGLRLLLVDDNPANQQVASELLSNDGAQVLVAGSGMQAIQALTGQSALPDLILMDIQMPEMDGYETTGIILRQLGTAAPPIVAMTANAMAADRTAALSAGMADHVGKPFDLAQLIEVILMHTRARQVAGGAPAPAPAPAPAQETAPVSLPEEAPALPAAGIDADAALKRMGGLKSVYRMALRSFADETVKLVEQIEAARSTQDARAVLTPLHTLKGLAGTIGAERVQALARQAEASLKQGADALAWNQLALVLDEIPAMLDQVAQLLGHNE